MAGTSVVSIVCWEEDGAWLGYLQEVPDYWTQGETLEDLDEHLRDLCREIANARRVRELAVS